MVLQTLGPSFVNALIAALVFAYLRVRDHERYLTIWAVAWLLWAARYGFGLAQATIELAPADWFLPVLALGRGALVLWGTHELLRRPLSTTWAAVLVVAFVLLVAETLTLYVPIPGPAGFLQYTVFAGALIWSGLLLVRHRTLPPLEARVSGAALILLGVAQTTYPFLSDLPDWYPSVAYVLVAGLQTLIPVGILMLYLRRSANEVSALHDALAGALTRALAEHMPICSHCKAIREAERWVKLESYVSTRTEATFSHGVCPSCFDEHYPDCGPYPVEDAPTAP